MRPLVFVIVFGVCGMAVAEQKVEAWRKAGSFEEKSKAAEGLGRSEDEEADVEIRRLFEARGTDAESIALRRMVLWVLAKNRAGWVAAVGDIAARDFDPGVRIAAVGVLFGRNVGGLVRLASEDEWPEVRKAAVAALGESVDPVARGVVLALVFARGESYETRTHAAGFVGEDAPSVGALLDGFVTFEEEAMTTERAHPLFRRVIAVLGKSKDARALPSLLRVAEHSPAPTVRAEAVLALGQFCSKDALRVIERARKDAQREVELAGRKAAVTSRKLCGDK